MGSYGTEELRIAEQASKEASIMLGKGQAHSMYENSKAKLFMASICKQSLEQNESNSVEGISLAYAIFGGHYE